MALERPDFSGPAFGMSIRVCFKDSNDSFPAETFRTNPLTPAVRRTFRSSAEGASVISARRYLPKRPLIRATLARSSRVHEVEAPGSGKITASTGKELMSRNSSISTSVSMQRTLAAFSEETAPMEVPLSWNAYTPLPASSKALASSVLNESVRIPQMTSDSVSLRSSAWVGPVRPETNIQSGETPVAVAASVFRFPEI